MEMTSGKHTGKTTEEVFVKEPDYAVWYMRELPESRAGKHLKRLEKAFDRKPFVVKCDGRCGKEAIRVSGYWGSPLLFFGALIVVRRAAVQSRKSYVTQ